jgi:hypothetical protein
MPDSHRFGASPSISWLLVLVLSAWPGSTPRAQDNCRLTSNQKMKAVKAFKALSPIFQDPRCLNCHGAVNPFIVDGGHPEYIDIVEEAKKFLGQSDAGASTISGNGPGQYRELQSIREIADSEAAVSDNDVIRVKAQAPMQNRCRECHVSAWDPIPHRVNHFVGRTWKQICMHLKTSSLTNTPVAFLRHMQSDAQVMLGFHGRRGLLNPPKAEPPSMPFDTMAKHANDWIDAMGGHFYQPAECGCEVEGLALEIRHRLFTNPDSGSSKAGFAQFDGTAVFNVELEEVAPGWYRKDDLVIRREVDVKHTKPSFWQCAGTGWRDERWQLSVQVDEQEQSMLVRFGFVDDGQEASWTCTAKGQTLTDPVTIDIHSTMKTLTMPTSDGAVGQSTAQLPQGQTDTRLIRQFESIAVSLIDAPSQSK